MKRMLDQKDIAKLKDLLSKISISEVEIDFGQVILQVGNLRIDGQNDEIWVNNLYVLVDENENPLFPLVGNPGKVLAVNEDEDGLVAVDLPSGGTKLYKHVLKNLGIAVAYVISTDSEELSTANYNSKSSSIITLKANSSYIIYAGIGYVDNGKVYVMRTEYLGSFGAFTSDYFTFDDDEVTPL